jgi:hypothetical protein
MSPPPHIVADMELVRNPELMKERITFMKEHIKTPTGDDDLVTEPNHPTIQEHEETARVLQEVQQTLTKFGFQTTYPTPSAV